MRAAFSLSPFGAGCASTLMKKITLACQPSQDHVLHFGASDTRNRAGVVINSVNASCKKVVGAIY